MQLVMSSDPWNFHYGLLDARAHKTGTQSREYVGEED